MTLGQFIILTIFFLMGICCMGYNFCIQIDQKKLTKVEVLLQIAAIMSMTILYGLGAIGCFCGIYNI